ncbi:hypothetical protein [Mycolicibacterium gilvum]|uniref:DNA primase/polymerase bifunctional N-terminal domain-containing protein n=1 Tax=Mycolicibacterium gilvum TaxID=1804 RepID=A0A378SP87_9MYCO|nr:hypothetical protein [Mycolicibacterium gilvum]MCV7053604.1 hypothetical protein [Mycolicibacterium gilvum]STZ43197.1 Uncharacterised protein [Mycolicibacterium gilvum]
MNEARQFLETCFGDAEGWLCGAVGSDPFRHPGGMYDHHEWNEVAVRWPRDVDRAADWFAERAPVGDVYVCPYLMRVPWREKGGSVRRALIHADVDIDVDEEKVARLGGFIVWSGTGGHGHVYVPLPSSVSVTRHEALCRRLAVTLDGDAKYTDKDLMRLPGTWNYKSIIDGGEPSPVVLQMGRDHAAGWPRGL